MKPRPSTIPSSYRATIRAILTDSQFWVPVIVLVVGLVVLVYVSR
ncbi:MAG: hypothetical protein ACRD3D_08060 [Terriglobia bacterium]